MLYVSTYTQSTRRPHAVSTADCWYTLSPCLTKTVQNCFCQNVIKFSPIFIIWGRKMAKTLKLCDVHSFSNSSNSRHRAIISRPIPLQTNPIPFHLKSLWGGTLIPIEGGLDIQVGSFVGQSAERPGFVSRRRRSVGQMEFVNIYLRFHLMLKYMLVFVVFVLINLRHCGKPWCWLGAAYRPC